MPSTSCEAMIPKARGMFAKRIRMPEYQELMRRRTVPEVAAILKRHPYFGNSLATLSATDPHREQIEDLLALDIFKKYQALVRYDSDRAGFASYFLTECEIREILRALSLINVGVPGAYLRVIPSYLIGHTAVDLYALGQAKTFPEAVETLRRTKYYRVLRTRAAVDPGLSRYDETEAALLRFYYEWLFALVASTIPKADQGTVKSLFLQEIELYNASLVMRVKAYFPAAYTAADIRGLLMPYRYHIPAARFDALVEAPSPAAFLDVFRAIPAVKTPVPDDPDKFTVAISKLRYANARRVLHLSASPYATMAAFLLLATIERDNVVNVTEGVRYGMPPETIQYLLEY